jgi:hypothetical protein
VAVALALALVVALALVQVMALANNDSELSTVSSSRYSGLDEGWCKEKALGAAKTLENIGASMATVTVRRTRSKGKRVHWE